MHRVLGSRRLGAGAAGAGAGLVDGALHGLGDHRVHVLPEVDLLLRQVVPGIGQQDELAGLQRLVGADAAMLYLALSR